MSNRTSDETLRAKADAIVSHWPYKGDAYFDRAVRDIAQALADERAEAPLRNRVEAVVAMIHGLHEDFQTPAMRSVVERLGAALDADDDE